MESKIRYAVLCYGVPLKISKAANLKEDGLENVREEFRRNEAAVDSELACLPFIEQNYLLAGPMRNPVFSLTNAAFLHPTNGILMVARLDGPTPEIARSLVDKAIQAETDGLWGRGYFDVRKIADPNLKPGDEWIQGAADITRIFGLESVVDQNAGTFTSGFPMSQIALYAGWYDEHVSGPFANAIVEFMPGAFAYHLHSFSAASLRSTTRNWVGPLLAKGVTATFGSVDEPYLMGTPDMAVFFARFLIHQFSFGEAAYASQNALSWQMTVVGDPLYRPFATPPPTQHKTLEERKSRLIEWSHLRVVNLNLVKGGTIPEVVDYLEQIPTTKESAVLTEKLAESYAKQGKPSSTIHALQQALKLDPSPQQKVRLLMELGDRLTSAERNVEALLIFRRFVKDFPDHAYRPTVEGKIASLMRKTATGSGQAK